jgi:flavin-dependent dehydrogenase
VIDVVIIGGGPAGSTSAARLIELGRSVLVLEKETFPRFRLGESLLPQTLHVLSALGMLDELKARYLVKNGAQFYDDLSPKSTRFAFDAAFDHSIGYAFQVPRDDFDAFLLERVARAGGTVRHGWTAERMLFDGERAVGVVARDPEGAVHRIEARCVVDASGRDALAAHAKRTTEPIRGLENTAVYTHCRGMPRESGDREGDIHIVLFEGGWHWVIPFSDGRTSIGAVITRPWLKANPHGKGDLDALLQRTIDVSPAMTRLVGDGERLWPARATADFSYRVGTMRGPGWVALGDAGGFIDPLFSTGVHIATWGAYHGATALSAALDGDGAQLDAWEPRLRAGAEMFLTAVQGFYARKLQPYMFTDNPRTYLRRAITSLLSGDVFSDARWARDMRTRLGPLVG